MNDLEAAIDDMLERFPKTLEYLAMTVREFREYLARFDQDLPVALIDDGSIEFVEKAEVETRLWGATPEKPILIIW